uniref:Phosphatidylinositol 4,5-bisphosphate 3-kinase catalytic subunit alpha isoform n=1 Tax=Schistocephalus solidus TaxID=70667 RepID=A0A0V0JBT1_SCHSO
MSPTAKEFDSDVFQHDFLLPNGIILSLAPDPDITLLGLKSHLWSLAAKEAFYDRLGPPTEYIFKSINSSAEEEELYDENRTFSSLDLMLPVIRLEKTADDSKVVALNTKNAMIARCSTICQMDLKAAEEASAEVSWARNSLLKISEANSRELEIGGSVAIARYLTAASQQPKLTASLKRCLQSLRHLKIGAWILDSSDPPQQRLLTLELPKEVTVAGALQYIIQQQTKLVKGDVSPDVERDFGSKLDPSMYLLKICCSQEYLYDSESVLIHYLYVQECIERTEVPKLSPVLLKDVLESLDLPVPQEGLNTVTTPTEAEPPSLMDLVDFDLSSPTGEAVADGDVKPESLWNLREYFAIIVRSAHTLSSGNGESLNWTPPPTSLEQISAGRPSSSLQASGRIDSTQTLQTALTNANSESLPAISAVVDPSSSLSSLGTSNKDIAAEVVTSGESPPTFLDGSWASVPTSGASAGTADPGALASARCNSAAVLSSPQYSYMVRVGISHGGQVLFEYQTTRDVQSSILTWNQPLNFHLFYADLPLATRVCVVLLRIKKRPGRIFEYPVGWANINLFDHNGFLLTGKRTLRLWPVAFLSPDAASHQINVSGTVVENPDPEILLQLEFLNPCPNRPVRFPLDKVKQAVTGDLLDASTTTATLHRMPSISTRKLEALRSDAATADTLLSMTGDQADELAIIRDLLSRDPFYELSEQDKAVLWRNREACRRHYPAALPWLVQAVPWERHEMVADFYRLLGAWPRPLPVEVSLALLGAAGLTTASTGENCVGNTGVADPLVRDVAVQGLQAGLANANLADYLLQLVQVLRTEAYMTNSLTCFLLQRALQCPTLIGLRLCWHLRAQIHNPDTRLRFGLLLDAFCRGCGLFVNLINDQVVALHRLTALGVAVKKLTDEEEQRAWFKSELAKAEVRRDLEKITSPLCFSVKLGSIIDHQCTVKRSKKRPLWIVWTNPDILGAHHNKKHQLLFKNGDDLRQDMLTLQLLKVMDRIWKDEGLNLHLTTYGCLATGDEVGLIEVVRNSQTIMSIQGQRVRSAMQIDSSQLHRWFLQNAQGDGLAYEAAVERFTNSCAGYCVATFVLGIRDRHNDNIMVDASGRLFHIDFGHILNNKKKKFGITRERVPFVLTSDFACVIARGEEKPYRSQGFIEFIKLCGNAYLVLRRHAHLILTLFAMMLPSGLPELTCVTDLEYVRKTLAVEMTEEEALRYFNEKFDEAYNGAWTTKIDWFAHWMRS